MKAFTEIKLKIELDKSEMIISKQLFDAATITSDKFYDVFESDEELKDWMYDNYNKKYNPNAKTVYSKETEYDMKCKFLSDVNHLIYCTFDNEGRYAFNGTITFIERS